MLRFLTATLAMVMLTAHPARAQLLPIPLPGLPTGLTPQLPPVRVAVNARDPDLQLARRLHVADLIRNNGDVIEGDPRGEPIVRGEVVAIAPSSEVVDRARAAGFIVIRAATLDGLGINVVVMAGPAGTPTKRALKTLRKLDPAGIYDFNHIYTRAGDVTSGTGPAPRNGDVMARAGAAKIGLLDGGIDPSHPVFANARIHRWGCEGNTVPSLHGTAVASLLVGRTSDFAGVLPSASLYAADVYCDHPTGGNVLALAAAFSWLATEGVPVINVSLVGPPDAMLEHVIARLVARGHIVVAAVGNDGPAAAPLYPAAYPGVIGVTGVDAGHRVLLEACRGPHVAFAAPGADMAAAGGAESFAAVRGTSFAAPIIAGLLALQLQDDANDASGAVILLTAGAIDLGRTGRDDIYGAGLVGDRFRVDPARLVTREFKGH